MSPEMCTFVMVHLDHALRPERSGLPTHLTSRRCDARRGRGLEAPFLDAVAGSGVGLAMAAASRAGPGIPQLAFLRQSMHLREF